MGERRYGEDYPFQDTTEYVPRRGIAQHPAVLILLLASIAGLLFLAYSSSTSESGTDVAAEDGDDSSDLASASTDDDSDDETGSDTATDDSMEDAGDAEEGAASDDSEADDSSDQSTVDLGPSASIDPPDAGPFVAARLNLDAQPGGGLFVLSGRVPDQTTADAVLQAAEVSYGPFVESQLQVDDSLEPAPWLAAAPTVIGLLPSVTDGTIMVADGAIHLSARSPNPGYLTTLQGALGILGGGLPVEMTDTKITNLEPPLFAAQAENGTITLSGYVPSEEVIELLVGGAAAAYGPENVVNELTVDAGTYRSFWMETTPGIFQLFRVFPQYGFTVEDGQFSGSIQGGVNFAADSTEITDVTAQALDIGVAVLARDISIGMLVIGHTDSQGPDEYNQELSLARAQSVIDYFAASGIDPARMLARGAGESAPIADNETDEGRARNRRVEFQFGSAESLQG